jgi:hypothetical protein
MRRQRKPVKFQKSYDVAAPAGPLRFFPEESIDDQQENGAHGGDENPAEVERLDLPETDEAAQKTADDRTGNPDENRDKDPAGVFPGHDEFGESAGNEA